MKSEIERAASKFTADLIELIKANVVARLTRPEMPTMTLSGTNRALGEAVGAASSGYARFADDVQTSLGATGVYSVSHKLGRSGHSETRITLDKPVTVPKGKLQVKRLERAVAKPAAVAARYAVRKSPPADVARKLDKHIGQALDRIREAGATGLKSRDLRKAFTEKRANQLLASLLKSGKVKRIGRTRGTRWVAVGAK
jgi:hypothetical protein